MIFFAAAFALLLHALFWGAGLAALATPRSWRRWWPVFAAPVGLALQSAVVWAGVYANFAGTDVYARWSEIIPVGLLILAIMRRRGPVMLQELKRFRGVALVMVACLIFLMEPMSHASRFLTTSSLGSCDAADYAAGARVLQEFARDDRSGFLGLTEVVQVASTDNFFDFWLRLNHFTPSALIAFNGAVFGWQHYQIIGVFTAVLVVLTIPGVFWFARSAMRLSPATSVWIGLIYGLSPVTWYAVAHIAMGQLLAAMAIVLLSWLGIALWRGEFSWRKGCTMSALLFAAYWLVMGSYNFIIVVAFVPILAFVGLQLLFRGGWSKLFPWLVCLLAPFFVCAVIFTQRTLGLIERFLLFQKTDFGWRIPMLTPEGWLGWVQGAGLNPVGLPWRIAVSLLFIVLLGLAAVHRGKARRWTTLLAVSVTLPILAGYAYLQWRGHTLGTNASYDAYKLLAVFFPGLLVAFCSWVVLLRSRWTSVRWVTALVAVLITVAHVTTAYRFSLRMERPPLIVGRELIDLQKIESMPTVTSINMLIPEFWSRLWANAFLLRKPQYFQEHTYEGRINTPLRGEWMLTDGFISVALPGKGESFRVTQGFNLVDQRSPQFIRAKLGDGWYGGEFSHRPFARWRWSMGNAHVIVENPHPYALTVSAEMTARSIGPRELQIWRDGIKLQSALLTRETRPAHFAPFTLPPGLSILEFRSDRPPEPPGPTDGRKLDFALYGIRLDVRPHMDISKDILPRS